MLETLRINEMNNRCSQGTTTSCDGGICSVKGQHLRWYGQSTRANARDDFDNVYMVSSSSWGQQQTCRSSCSFFFFLAATTDKRLA
jgi:hypothetical protein